MSNNEQTPDFFIVGAPKSGTTSLHYYLSQHPDILMAPKEIHYFGKDLEYTTSRPTWEEYQEHFTTNNGQQLNGDGSIWYLYSKTFADEVKKINPYPKIIILLRNPVEMVYSLHSQNIYDANEDELDFEKAWDLESDRRKGENLPKTGNLLLSVFYKEAASFYEPVKKVINDFGKEHVFIATYDDFKKSNKEVVDQIIKFLGLPKYEDIDYSIKNPGKQIKNTKLHQTIKSPSGFKRQLVRILIPIKPLRKKIIHSLYERNMDYSKRSPLSSQMEEKLKAFFKEDIKKLQELLGKDLSTWL